MRLRGRVNEQLKVGRVSPLRAAARITNAGNLAPLKPLRSDSSAKLSGWAAVEGRQLGAQRKSRLLEGFVNQPDRLKAGLRTTISPEARWPIGGSEATVQPRSAATRFRAGHPRARGTFDKPTTPETANNFQTPGTVSRKNANQKEVQPRMDAD